MVGELFTLLSRGKGISTLRWLQDSNPWIAELYRGVIEALLPRLVLAPKWGWCSLPSEPGVPRVIDDTSLSIGVENAARSAPYGIVHAFKTTCLDHLDHAGRVWSPPIRWITA